MCVCATCLIHFLGESNVRAIWMYTHVVWKCVCVLDVSLQTETFSKSTTKTLENYVR